MVQVLIRINQLVDEALAGLGQGDPGGVRKVLRKVKNLLETGSEEDGKEESLSTPAKMI